MAHLIDQTVRKNGSAMFAFKPAWHGLGVVIDHAATSAEAIELAGLGWTVEQWPVVAESTGRRSEVPNRFANVRADTGRVLGVVSEQYRPFQNAEAFDFMDALVGERLAMYETAGALCGGERIWMLARIPKEYRIAGNDVVMPYVLLTNGHDGKNALRMLPTTVRVVCNNTLSLALGNGAGCGLSIPHFRTSLPQRVEEARRNLGVIAKRLDRFGEEAQAMAARKLAGAEMRNYLDGLFPVKAAPAVGFDSLVARRAQHDAFVDELLAGAQRQQDLENARNRKIVDDILANYGNERNALPGVEGTAWAAYNAVSEWVDHQRTYRSSTTTRRADAKLQSVWFGSGNAIKQQAYSAALALAS